MGKVVEFEDKGIKYVLLERGKYLVDGNVVMIDTYYGKEQVGVKDENNIRKISETKVTDHYINIEDDTKMSEYEYEEKRKELVKHRTYDEYDDAVWDSLESEFNYRKFSQTWKRVDKVIQVISDPILVEKVYLKYNTGNKFIRSAYLNGEDSPCCDLYIYSRKAAHLHITKECFDELGMTHEKNCGYEYTKTRKVWSGGDSDSGIRYVKAFGNYIFGKEFDHIRSPKGTYEDMVKRYEEDRSLIRGIIKRNYIATFGNADENKVDFKQLLKDLNSLREEINSIESKKVTWSNQNTANRKINEIINYIEDKFE